MRASYIIRAINFWFARLVYQRDALDESLEEMIDDSESAFGLVLMAAALCVGATRIVLWVFMVVGHAASCFLMRQMEFDADRYEVEISGSENFASTSRAMHEMGFAQHAAILGMRNLLAKAVMIDDLPKMNQLLRGQLTRNQRENLKKTLDEERTGLFDSHPCTRQRIEVAARAEAEGMFTAERPARELFRNFDALCRNVTQDFYRNAIGRMVNPNEMEPVERHIHGLISSK